MGKFDNKEATRANTKSTAKSMGDKNTKIEKKLISFQAPVEMYKKFTYINQQLGITNTTAINLFIANYVKEHSELI